MRHIVYPVRNPPRGHLYHVALFTCDTSSFVRGLSSAVGSASVTWDFVREIFGFKKIKKNKIKPIRKLYT